jgi:RNase P subunit RPR2
VSELIFCCPNCLAISSSGAIIDDRSARQATRSSMRVMCEQCDQASTIPMLDFLLSNSFSSVAQGSFARI